jgi:hypothetical protein
VAGLLSLGGFGATRAVWWPRRFYDKVCYRPASPDRRLARDALRVDWVVAATPNTSELLERDGKAGDKIACPTRIEVDQTNV